MEINLDFAADLSKNLKCSGGRAKCYSVCVFVPDILAVIEIFGKDELMSGENWTVP